MLTTALETGRLLQGDTRFGLLTGHADSGSAWMAAMTLPSSGGARRPIEVPGIRDV